MQKSIFNLNDEGVLTHKGHTIEEVEALDDPRSDDETDEEDEKLEGNLIFWVSRGCASF